MITLEITHSPSRDKIGIYEFYKNLIYIGNQANNDLYIDNSSFIANHLFVEVVDSKLIVQLHPNIEQILVNKKKITKYSYLKVGDVFSVADTSFKVIAFIKTEWEYYNDQLTAETDKLIQEKSPLLPIIQEIYKEMEFDEKTKE